MYGHAYTCVVCVCVIVAVNVTGVDTKGYTV